MWSTPAERIRWTNDLATGLTHAADELAALEFSLEHLRGALQAAACHAYLARRSGPGPSRGADVVALRASAIADPEAPTAVPSIPHAAVAQTHGGAHSPPNNRA